MVICPSNIDIKWSLPSKIVWWRHLNLFPSQPGDSSEHFIKGPCLPLTRAQTCIPKVGIPSSLVMLLSQVMTCPSAQVSLFFFYHWLPSLSTCTMSTATQPYSDEISQCIPSNRSRKCFCWARQLKSYYTFWWSKYNGYL